MTRPARPLLAVWLVALTCLVPAASVATETPAARLGLTPVGVAAAYFELSLSPGEHRELQVEAANFGADAVLARTYLHGDEPTGTTSWLAYQDREMALGPREAVAIPFTVTVPSEAPPGQYIAALVIQNAEPMRGSGALAMDQVNRSAIAVAIDVPGARDPRLRIGAVGHKTVAGHSIVTVEVRNPGNVHLKPGGTFRLFDASASEIAAGSVVMDSVYATQAAGLEIPLADPLRAGTYCVGLSLRDEATGANDANQCLKFSVGSPIARSDPGAGPGELPRTSAALAEVGISLLAIGGAALVAGALLLVPWRRAARHEPDRAGGSHA
jgi:hypothetical protein